MTILCKTRKEAISKKDKFYFTGKPCKRGHVSKRITSDRHCVDCVKQYEVDNKENIKARNAERYNKNKDVILKNNAKWRLENFDKVKKISADYRKNHSNVVKKSQDEHRKNNLDSIKKSQVKYRLLNLDKFAARRAKRRAAKLNRTPSWLTNYDKRFIKDLYAVALKLSEETGIKQHVDHVIPLQGDFVSGLHVPNNLQLLTANFNLSKGNHFAVN